MQNIVELVALIAIAALLAWSGFRTWRVKNRIVKWGGAGLLALLSVAVLSASALTSLGMIKQHSRSARIPDIKVAATPELSKRCSAPTFQMMTGSESLRSGFDRWA
jgi:hypothetical protein